MGLVPVACLLWVQELKHSLDTSHVPDNRSFLSKGGARATSTNDDGSII